MKTGRIVLWQTFSMDLPFDKYENTILLYPDTVYRHGLLGGYAPLLTARNAFGVPVKFATYSGDNAFSQNKQPSITALIGSFRSKLQTFGCKTETLSGCLNSGSLTIKKSVIEHRSLQTQSRSVLTGFSKKQTQWRTSNV